MNLYLYSAIVIQFYSSMALWLYGSMVLEFDGEPGGHTPGRDGRSKCKDSIVLYLRKVL